MSKCALVYYQNIFYVNSFEHKDLLKAKGFSWCPYQKAFFTYDAELIFNIRSLFYEHDFNDAVHKYNSNIKRLEIPVPEGLSYLPFQVDGISRMFNKRFTLLSDEQGIGKTIQVLGFINLHDDMENILIICPSSLVLNWYKEASKWLVKKRSNFKVISYDKFARHREKEEKYDLVVLDEAHYIKNIKAKRTTAIIGDRYKTAVDSYYKIAVTGTPIPNCHSEIYPILKFFAYNFMNYMSFGKKYCGSSYYAPSGIDFRSSKNSEMLEKYLRKSVMIRRLKKDVLKDLPEKIRQIIPMEIKENKFLKEKESLFKVDNALDFESTVKHLTAVTTSFEDLALYRKEIALAKIKPSINFIKEMLESVESVIVFAHHKEVVTKLEYALIDFGVSKVIGGMSAEDKNEAVEKFQAKQNRVFIGNILASGVGLTLTASSTVIFVELDWTPSNIVQAEDRAHRISQTEIVNVYYLVADNSLDAHIAQTLIHKAELISRTLGDNKI